MINIPIDIEIQERIRLISVRNYPNESCGFILENGLVYEIESKYTTHVDIPAIEFINAEKISPIKVVWHSHTGEDNIDFSKIDIDHSYSLELPFFLIHIPSGHRQYFDPKVILPYEGREWKIYQNCYSLGRDIYRKELGIELKPFVFDSPKDWVTFNPFEKLRPLENGFVPIALEAPLKKFDIFLFRPPGASYPVHIGIIWNPSLRLFYHHASDCLSSLAILGESWNQFLEQRLRHKNLC